MRDSVAMSKDETRKRVPMVLSPRSVELGWKNLSEADTFFLKRGVVLLKILLCNFTAESISR